MNMEDFGKVAICALRYAMGQRNSMPGDIRKAIRPYLSQLSDMQIAITLDDCKQQERTQSYGDPLIDKPGGLEWRSILNSEQKRRNKYGNH